MKENKRKHRFSYRVPLYEIDLGSALYHGNYFHLLEIARDDLWREIGFPYKRLMELHLHLTIVESQCRYIKPIFYDEEVEIITSIDKIGSRSLALLQKIARSADNLLCTEATIKMVCVTFSGKPTLLPKQFKKALQAWSQAIPEFSTLS